VHDSLGKRSVLAVDDDPVLHKIAKVSLEDAGFDVITACDMQSAQALFHSVDVEGIACVLVDYELPGRAGIDLVEWLNQHYPALATIMITAPPDHWVLERSLRARVCAFLGKPLVPADFLRAVENAATVTEQRRAGAEMREQVATASHYQKMMLARMLRRGDVSLEYRFYPKHYASGDFLAYYSLSGRDVFLMSDAAGHDLRASVHSSYFQGMLSGLLTGGRPLAEALQEYNSFLVDQPAGALSSISVTALEVQCKAGCVGAWNWGGPPPVFLDALGWVRTIGAPSSSPLGWFEDAQPTFEYVGLPRGPIWMWTDGLEGLAERMNASPLSIACSLLSVPSGKAPPFLAQAEDDVLVARIWPGIPAGSLAPDYEEPLVADEYGPDQVGSIDRLQARWVHSLQLALPWLSPRVRYDLILSAREAVLNALKHGCGPYDKARFQITRAPSSLLRVRVSDPGLGYSFDVMRHNADDVSNPGELHRGLMLMHAHAPRVTTARAGAAVMMEFPLESKAAM
jgi:FixJ family two-component response regulator